MEIKNYFMTKPSISQSQKRFQESVGALFSSTAPLSGLSCLFLKSSSDIGVIRNGGRNGARFAPQSFLATFKKFSQNKTLSELAFYDFEVASQEEEVTDFHSAQIQETERISSILQTYPNSRICHLGGGHDHIYPLLSALGKSRKKIIVINIDAHADTRTDDQFHSGTPFRQFANEFPGEFQLYQIGLHPFANSFSTLTPLARGKGASLWKKDLNPESLQSLFKEIEKEIDADTLIVFSLDADALIGSEVPGVSAVNPGGLTRNELLTVWNHYKKLPLAHLPVLGIYELNPIYDSLSSFSMRTLASFVFESLE
jgi:formiminoglutamase